MTHAGRKGHEPLDLTTLATNVKTARELYEEAGRAVELAQKQKSDSLERLNDAQRQFDDAVARIRENPEAHSEWGRLASNARNRPG